MTLSSQDSRFARLVERFQSAVEDGIWEIAHRHLRLKGYPKESYNDLMIKMTPPSDWRELSRADVITARITNASTIKSSLTSIFKSSLTSSTSNTILNNIIIEKSK